MWDWLSAPIDPSRAHDISQAVAWHARSMVLAWGILAPLAVIGARFFKIMPGQNWPDELDNPVWWRGHWIGQTGVLLISLFGFWLVRPADVSEAGLHALLGYALLFGLCAQVLLGIFRGSKGGPTAPGKDGSFRGHHYDMTPRRQLFEAVHKTLGYGLLAMAAATILSGLWKANGPMWMWLVLLLWWLALIAMFIGLQRQGRAVDTYQAIWGDDPAHPGNRLPAPGWGVRRPSEANGRETYVRSD